MTFKDGKMFYLTFIYLCEDANIRWEASLTDDMDYDASKIEERHKKRLVLWGYKKKLFSGKDLTKGITLTKKGMKYIRERMTEEHVVWAKSVLENAAAIHVI